MLLRTVFVAVLAGLMCSSACGQEYILQVPGRAQASFATLTARGLIVRDAVGEEFEYERVGEHDTPDRKFLGYYCPASDVWLLWPASGAGNMLIGRTTPDGQVQYRPSQMQVQRVVRGPQPGVRPPPPNPPPENAPPPPDDLQPFDELPEKIPPAKFPPLDVPFEKPAAPPRDAPLDLSGAWFVEGLPPDAPLPRISRHRDGQHWDIWDGQGQQGIAEAPPQGGPLVIDWAGNIRVRGTVERDVLRLGDVAWKRIQVLGCYFDARERPHEIVVHEDHVQVRSAAEGRVVYEPLLVHSAVDVESPRRGRARLRNGRLYWPQTKEDWAGPIWLQGVWEMHGRPCLIEQDGQKLRFTNETGAPSKGVVRTRRAVFASDWQLPGLLNRRQTSIVWENGDQWDRPGAEDFP